ncbi:MAG: 30S ribosomal protein S20 [Christensenellaceae bacterium]
MPNIKSAKKRVLVIEKKTSENRSAVQRIKTAMKKLNAAIEANDKALAQELYKEVAKLLDSSVSSGLTHVNTAANKKSGFAKRINKMA